MADQKPGLRTWPIISATISAIALGLAVIHVMFPEAKIDNLTVALFIIGVAPWLAPLFKSIELPGGWKFEFQEFRRQVEQELRQGAEKVGHLESRVQRVEQFAFSGALTSENKEHLNAALAAYHAYLNDLGLDTGEEQPSVHITHEPYDNAHYDGMKKQIVMGQNFAKDNDVMFREYTHHALTSRIQGGSTGLGSGSMAIESGLADYFPCSFKNDPKLGPQIATILRETHGLQHPYLRNLLNTRTFAEVKPNTISQDAGEIWGGAFWEIRNQLGARTADKILVSAWLRTHIPAPSGEVATTFVHSIVAAVRADHGSAIADDVQALFKRREFAR